MVPNDELRFNSIDKAKEFYHKYASKAGFDVRITKSHKTVIELNCNKQGHWDFTSPGRRESKRKCQ